VSFTGTFLAAAIGAAALIVPAATGPAYGQGQGPVLNTPRVPAPGETRTARVNEQTLTTVYTGRNGNLDCWTQRSSNGSTGQFCNTLEGNLVSRQGAVFPPVQMNPHTGQLSFPLYVGKQWEMQYSSVQGIEGARNQTRKAQVVSYEKITVPAGTFDVFKIQHTRTVWGGNLQDSAGARQGINRPFATEGVAYYSDKAGVVKADEGTDHFELLDYSPKR